VFLFFYFSPLKTIFMPRLRSYSTPHKGLRNILGQFSNLAGQTDYSDIAQVDALKAMGKEMFAMLDDHVHIEDEILLKALDSRAENASEHDHRDHEEIEKLQAALQQRLEALDGNQDPDAGHEFYLTFTEFHSRYLAHIHHEESVTEKQLWRHFTDEELLGIRMQVLKQVPPSLTLTWWKYIIPAQNEAENVRFLSGVRANAPEEVFQAALTTIKPQLGAERYQSLVRKLEAAEVA